jgi:hypothetical protein
MSKRFRLGLSVVGGVVLLFALGFLMQQRWATAFWPVPAGPLSNVFVASILAAIGVPALWIAWTDERRALAAGAIDLAITNGGITGAGIWFYLTTGNLAILATAAATAVLFLLCILLFRYGHGAFFRDTRPMPTAVRIAFVVFAALLAVTATALLVVRPNTFPWPLSAENSVIYGFIFYGAMAYFLYGIIYPVWGNARGQFLGFLAYDVVLIPPFLQHFATVKPEMKASLTVYTSVLVASGLLAAWYLFLDRSTRFGPQKAAT